MTTDEMPRLRIVTFAPHLPYPEIGHAGGLFLYHWLDGIARRGHDITLVTPAVERNLQVATARDVSFRTHLVPIDRHAEAQWRRLLVYAFDVGRGVTPGRIIERSIRLDKDTIALCRDADLIELQWSQYLALIPWLEEAAPGTPIAALLHDVLTQSLERRASTLRSRWRRLTARLMLATARRTEPALLNRCGYVTTFGANGVATLKELGVTVPVAEVAPWIDIPHRVRRAPPSSRILFVGSMFRPENTEGLRWFLDEVWPKVRRDTPESRLDVAGADPPGWLTSLKDSAVQAHGFVADLGELYAQASLAICPVLTGAGVKFKVLEAMSHAVPVVSTRLGAEGIAERAPAPGFLAIDDDADAWATHVVEALASPAVCRQIGDAGREWVANSYDFDRSLDETLLEYAALIP